MGYDSGSLSFMRYKVTGQIDRGPQDLLKLVEGQLLSNYEGGLPAEVEWGWAGPNHVLDNQINYLNCVFVDCMFFSLKIVTNKVPPELKRAWQAEIKFAIAKDNPSGFISKIQKRQAKEQLNRKVEDEIRSGKYCRSKIIPILWDSEAGVIYGPASVSAREKLTELFSRTFPGCDLVPMTSGNVAMQLTDTRGNRRGYEDLQPTRFAMSPEDPSAAAEYPWIARGDGAKDYLGNEFLLWLWFESQTRSGTIRIGDKEAVIVFDRSLQLDCVYNHTGKDTLNATGPTRMPEAIDALRSGKVPRKAGLIADMPSGQFNFTLVGETLAITGLKLPEIEDADTARTLFEERIALLRDFSKTLDQLFDQFLYDRLTDWSRVLNDITSWLAKHRKHQEAEA